MAPQHWQQVKVILDEALQREPGETRDSYVAQTCADDTTLRREVQSFLAGGSEGVEACAENLRNVLRHRMWSDPIGRRLGAYRIMREIGRGGMGAVYLAQRADGQFEKEVAVKLLKRGTDTDEILRRFSSERQILARLDHPSIARLLDAGTSDDGLPFFVMEYVAGIPVTRYVVERQMALAERLQLFLKICAAVESAHRKLVVHRDLKPSNILVNAEGEPKLLDFGIAKVLAERDETSDLTATQHQRLTPNYASPEQARGRAVTPASDIYALGALLYEILTGKTPHHFSTAHPSFQEVARVLDECEPDLPSEVADDHERRDQLRGDLDHIVLRALRKDPSSRYSSVASFAEDIRRYLTNRPIQARSGTIKYRVRRFLVRSKALFARHVGMVVGLSIAGLIIALFTFFRPGLHAPTPNSVSTPKQPAQLIPEKSIAVLPFDSFGNNPDESYFIDGVQDDILTDLAKVADLKVISRNSVAAFRGVAKNAREIGQALSVSYVLEGSVQRSGDRIRVNAQLIDARTQAEVWAERYDRKIDDLFILQSELAQTIVSQLRATLSANEKAAIENRPTTDMLAYDLYLRARESFFQMNYAKTIQLLETAIARDSQFALAYCLMTEAHLYIYRFRDDKTPDRLAKAREAAETALRLVPDLAESHLAKAQYYYYGLRDYEKAQAELTTTAPSPTGRAKFIDLAALTERRLGHWKAAIRDGERATELDPHNPFTANELVESYIAVRRFPEADQLADKAIKLIAPQNGYLWGLKSESLLARGRIDEARAVLESAPLDTRDRIYRLAQVAMFARDFTKAAQLLASVPPPEGENYGIPFLDGIVAHAQGDAERARSSFQIARARLTAKLLAQPNDPDLLSNLSLTDACLGRKEDALRESRQAVQLVPVSRDAVDGPFYAKTLAQVYVLTGEYDAALRELTAIAKLPRGPSYGELRFDPIWDEIRAKPRFNGLMSQAAEAPVIE